ncbi:glycosyltransferase family 4 protein [Croceiramulus getboli]|nr:glycosyltransferase family 4 protein [Flavobacteriaceae bacterium YJPT1-3]
MHLGFISPEYPHPKVKRNAGIGSAVAQLTQALVAQGVEVSVFIYGQTEDQVLEASGVKLHLIAQRKYMVGGWYLYRKFLQRYVNKRVLLEKIDALEAPDWTGITAFARFKCPLVIRLHGSDAYFCHLDGRSQKKKNRWFEKNALEGADAILSVSQFCAQLTQDIFGIERSITVIPNGVELPEQIHTEANQSAPLLFYFGSIIRKKGVLELPGILDKVLQDHPDCQMVLAGKDTTDVQTGKSTLELLNDLWTPKAKSQVEYLGMLNKEEVHSWLRKATVVLLPSYAEAMPMAWLEAMAEGKALVTSDIGWAAEVMEQGVTGYMAPPQDHAQWARSINTLLDDAELRKEMGIAAREQIKTHFEITQVAQKSKEYYQSLIASHERV